jgi:isoleucyl-tRNA synthetase
VTYANLDGWSPDPSEKLQYSTLDQWLRSALHTLVREVTNALENYDALGATRPISTFVDQLSNWYLRRSRRRFWKSGSDADKRAAYATLYEALATLSKLLAPSMPFIAEELYQNLEKPLNPQASDSVHLASWPKFSEDVIDEGLNRDMALVMKLASLGHAARNKANRKVRQPLAEAAFAVGGSDEQDVIVRYADLLEDELNVKHVRSLMAAGEAAAFALNPLPKQLGQKYGRLFPQIRAAILALDTDAAAQKVLAGQSVMVDVDKTLYEILPEEIEIRVQAKSGFAVAADGAYLAALVTDLTPELVNEGLAREFVRRVQDLRKTADLEIADRIKLYYQVTPGLATAVKAFSEYILGETLTVALEEGAGPAGLPALTDEFDGEKMTAAIEKQ